MKGQTSNTSKHADLPETSLIIASRNRPEMLAEAVASILQGEELPTELIIIDQSEVSHPRLATLEADRLSTLRYFWTQSVGVSRARNEGLAVAQSNILVLTDDDVLVTPSWFGTLVRALLKAGTRSVVTGQVLPDKTEKPGSFAPSTKVDRNPHVYEGRIGEDVLYPNVALYRATINEVGGFDERLGPGTPFPAAEDNDLGFRLLEAGYRIVYAPEAVLYHRAWRSNREYLPLCWHYGHGQGGYYGKHLSLHDRYMLRRIMIDLRVLATRFIRYLWRQPRRACGEVMYLLGLLAGVVQWLLTQRRTP